ncbi:uncharacterized protein N7529_000008 [Penicillium soppii]|uniref:uncharacterized protein n=1 Tax=Penicillium soppii TaxID=69789 RepID=UPI0025479ED0|nr:uncharacterized protein N7529_000008 [Penicillium soppii]KAJ5881336.1 hypothetical protein N7529_000008 [Penicillium soppii]
MIYLCISKFELEIQEAKELKKFFSLDEIKALREEKDKRSKDIESDSISDTEEQAIADSKDLIDVITNDDVNDDVDDDIDDDVDELGPRIRTSGRKRKITLDDEFETY